MLMNFLGIDCIHGHFNHEPLVFEDMLFPFSFIFAIDSSIIGKYQYVNDV